MTNLTPMILHGLPATQGSAARPAARNLVIVGTVGRSPLIDRLVRDKKIDPTAIAGRWESFFLQTVADPLPGISSALVIAGSDKRGTIYGIYDLSEQIGVSPWYWWADVTREHKGALFITPGKHQQGEPSVKYRGIFFNDEKPDLDYGRTLSGMRAEAPVDAPAAIPGTNAPCLEYQMYISTAGPVTATLILAPTLNFVPGRGLRLAVSFDGEAPQLATIVPATYNAAGRDWEESVKNNARTVATPHVLPAAGYHTLKVWMVDPAVVVQKIVVTTSEGEGRTSYLGPPESYHALPAVAAAPQ